MGLTRGGKGRWDGVKPQDLYLEVGFLCGATGAAMIWPPLAFAFACAFFLAFAAVWAIAEWRAPDSGPDEPVTGQDS